MIVGNRETGSSSFWRNAKGGFLVSGTAILKGTGILSGDTGLFIVSSVPGGFGTSGGVLVNQSTITGGRTIGDNLVANKNQGTINAANPSARLIFSGLPDINSGLMEASGGATLELETTVNNNGGTITAQPGSFVLLAQNGNLGPNMVSGGTLVVTGAFNAVGVQQLGLQPGMTLLGRGTVVGDMTSSGTVIAGDSVTAPGTLTVQGSYMQNPSGLLEVTVWGNSSCTGRYCPKMPSRPSSLVAVANSATLNGTLKVTLSGFVPQVGSQFTILTGAAINGKFATVNGLAINSSEHFSIPYSPTTVTLTVVPGP